MRCGRTSGLTVGTRLPSSFLDSAFATVVFVALSCYVMFFIVFLLSDFE
jgi:hypothetical protein